MPDWMIAAIASGIPGVAAAGALWWRVARLEKDVELRVTRELFDASHKGVADKLDKIEAMLERLYDRMDRRNHDTDPGARR